MFGTGDCLLSVCAVFHCDCWFPHRDGSLTEVIKKKKQEQTWSTFRHVVLLCAINYQLRNTAKLELFKTRCAKKKDDCSTILHAYIINTFFYVFFTWKVEIWKQCFPFIFKTKNTSRPLYTPEDNILAACHFIPDKTCPFCCHSALHFPWAVV